jgi:hypothetical protein
MKIGSEMTWQEFFFNHGFIWNTMYVGKYFNVERLLTHACILYFIGKLDISRWCVLLIVWITEQTLIHKNIRSVCNSHVQVYWSIWRKTHYDVTDKNNNISSEGLDRHYHKYHSSSYGTRWDISNNVCLDLQKLPLFYIYHLIILYLYSV